MVLTYAIILLVLLALLLRRDLSAIGRIAFRGSWWLVIIVISLFALQATLVLYLPGQSSWQMVLLIASQFALLGVVLLNHFVPGAKLFALGIALNLLVMVANGGWMPVTPETYQFVHPERIVTLYTKPASSKNIILPRAETKLWYLSDVIRLPLPGRRTAVSLGDVLLIGGVAQLIMQTTSKKKELASHEREQPVEKVI
jgi:hypothetical protein